MAFGIDDAILACVQEQLENSLRRIRHSEPAENWRVAPFGSQVYGLSTATSDYDLSVAVSPKDEHFCTDLLYFLRESIDATRTLKPSTLELSNKTLKWDDKEFKVSVSILVAPRADVHEALATTRFLKRFFETREDYKAPVLQVAKFLRTGKALGGQDEAVGQNMKSAPFFVLCAAIKAESPDIATDAALFAALSQFQAHALTIEIDEESSTVQTVPRAHWQDRTQTLHITPAKFGSSRLTEPAWAFLQHICHNLAYLLGPSPLPLFNPLSLINFPLGSANFQQLRVLVKDTWRHHDVPVVATLWPRRSQRQPVGTGALLIVIMGNGNDRYARADNYDQTVCITWGSDHTTNPIWFPQYLLHLCHQAAIHYTHVDIYAASRGAAAVLFSLRAGGGLHLRLANAYRHMVLSAPCVWMRQEQSLADEVLRGLHEVAQRRREPPLRLVVASKMDASVREEGDTSLTGSKKNALITKLSGRRSRDSRKRPVS